MSIVFFEFNFTAAINMYMYMLNAENITLCGYSQIRYVNIWCQSLSYDNSKITDSIYWCNLSLRNQKFIHQFSAEDPFNSLSVTTTVGPQQREITY